jgi:hypothetical protein
MKTVRIAAAQTIEFREDVKAALNCVADVAARAKTEGASLLCFPECFLSGYLTDETPARRNALDLASPASQGRQPAKPGAHSASLDRRRLVRQRLARCRRRGNVEPGSVSLTHCAELLCAKQNFDSCKLAHARKVAISLCTITRPTAAHLALLSCYQAVDVSRLVSPAKFFDKLRR